MVIVYVLKNKEGKLYKGLTTNLEKRLLYHNKGLSWWTRDKGPWEVVYTETCSNESEAIQREKFLKSGQGREFLKSVLKFRDVAQPG